MKIYKIQTCDNCHFKGDDNECHRDEGLYVLTAIKEVIWHEDDQCGFWRPKQSPDTPPDFTRQP